jgi:hypothetical protein
VLQIVLGLVSWVTAAGWGGRLRLWLLKSRLKSSGRRRQAPSSSACPRPHLSPLSLEAKSLEMEGTTRLANSSGPMDLPMSSSEDTAEAGAPPAQQQPRLDQPPYGRCSWQRGATGARGWPSPRCSARGRGGRAGAGKG